MTSEKNVAWQDRTESEWEQLSFSFSLHLSSWFTALTMLNKLPIWVDHRIKDSCKVWVFRAWAKAGILYEVVSTHLSCMQYSVMCVIYYLFIKQGKTVGTKVNCITCMNAFCAKTKIGPHSLKRCPRAAGISSWAMTEPTWETNLFMVPHC